MQAIGGAQCLTRLLSSFPIWLKYTSLYSKLGVLRLSYLSCSYIIWLFTLTPFISQLLTISSFLGIVARGRGSDWSLNRCCSCCTCHFYGQTGNYCLNEHFVLPVDLGHLFNPPGSLYISISAYFICISDPSLYLSPQIIVHKSKDYVTIFFLYPKGYPKSWCTEDCSINVCLIRGWKKVQMADGLHGVVILQSSG